MYLVLPVVSPLRGTVGGSRGGAEVTGLAFLEIQRDLLKQLESLFVSIADDRCACLPSTCVSIHPLFIA